jgi:hypothetical protein
MNPSTLVERWQLAQAINADPELSASAKTVAVALLGFVNSKTGECYPALEKIMARCHVSKATAVRATQALESRRWVMIERDTGGDREANRYHFVFDRIRGGSTQTTATSEAPGADEVHGIKFEPCADAHSLKSEPSMVSNLTVHGVKSEPELEEDKSITGTQESLFGEGGSPEVPAFDLDAWFEREWWPQYPPERRVEKADAKKRIKQIIEGRRGDGLKATPDELLAGVLRYAAAMMGKDPQYIKHPTTWLNKGCWTDERAERAAVGNRRMSPSEEAVWRAGEEMAVRSKRAAG